MADDLDDFNANQYEDVMWDGEIFESYSALFSVRENAYSNFHSIDISDDVVSKEIGKTDRKEPNVAKNLESAKQQELLKNRDVVSYDLVSESKLQFAPQWIWDVTPFRYKFETARNTTRSRNAL